MTGQREDLLDEVVLSLIRKMMINKSFDGVKGGILASSEHEL